MSKDKSKSPQPDAGGGDEEGGFVSTNWHSLIYVYSRGVIIMFMLFKLRTQFIIFPFFYFTGLGKMNDVCYFKYLFNGDIVSQTLQITNCNCCDVCKNKNPGLFWYYDVLY